MTETQLPHYNRLASCSSEGSYRAAEHSTSVDTESFKSSGPDTPQKATNVDDGEFKEISIEHHMACTGTTLKYDASEVTCHEDTGYVQEIREYAERYRPKYQQTDLCICRQFNCLDHKVKTKAKCRSDSETETVNILGSISTDYETRFCNRILDDFVIIRKEQSILNKKLSRFQNLYLILAVVSILLIFCVVIALPTTMLSIKMVEIPEDKITDAVRKELMSADTMPHIKRVVFCTACDHVEYIFRDVFHRGPFPGECCIEDFLTLIQLSSDNSKKVKDLESAIKDLSLHIVSVNSSETFNISKIQYRIHSRVDKLDGMLSILLHRKRAAIHLRSKGIKDEMPVWKTETQENMEYNHHKIHIPDAGRYFIYSRLRFRKRNCAPGSTFGYQIKGSSSNENIASITHECERDIDNNDHGQDLSIQTMYFFHQKNMVVHIHLDSKSKVLLDDGDEHYFGVFQI